MQTVLYTWLVMQDVLETVLHAYHQQRENVINNMANLIKYT